MLLRHIRWTECSGKGCAINMTNNSSHDNMRLLRGLGLSWKLRFSIWKTESTNIPVTQLLETNELITEWCVSGTAINNQGKHCYFINSMFKHYRAWECLCEAYHCPLNRGCAVSSFLLCQALSLSAPGQWSRYMTAWQCRTCWTPSQTRSYITSASQGARFSSSWGGRPSCSFCCPTSGTWGDMKNMQLC